MSKRLGLLAVAGVMAAGCDTVREDGTGTPTSLAALPGLQVEVQGGLFLLEERWRFTVHTAWEGSDDDGLGVDCLKHADDLQVAFGPRAPADPWFGGISASNGFGATNERCTGGSFTFDGVDPFVDLTAETLSFTLTDTSGTVTVVMNNPFRDARRFTPELPDPVEVPAGGSFVIPWPAEGDSLRLDHDGGLVMLPEQGSGSVALHATLDADAGGLVVEVPADAPIGDGTFSGPSFQPAFPRCDAQACTAYFDSFFHHPIRVTAP